MSSLNMNVCILSILLIAITMANSETNATDALAHSETNTTDAQAAKTIVEEEVTIYKQKGTKADLCKDRPCIRKCCQISSAAYMKDEFDNSGNCKSKKALNLTLGLPNPAIYNRDLEVTGKILNSTFQILKGYPIIRDGWLVTKDFFIIEDGKLVVELPNHYDRYVDYDVDTFCVDYVKLRTDRVELRPFILPHIEEKERDHKVSLVAMLISSAFLIATLAVYSYVPRLYRKLHGKVLIAYAACLLGFFLTHSIYQLVYEINGSIKILCHILGVPSYFAILASFFWMNVMSFDIWLQIRNVTYSNTLSKYDKRFIKYCAYGFGAPLAMTITFAFLNYLPMDRINRAVVTPGITNKGCFLGGMERLFYLYIPMAILIAANFIMFVATSVVIYRTDFKVPNSRKYKFLMYIKVFLVMGISWVLEIISSFQSNLLVSKFADSYNYLMGFFIFVIFVCNRRVFKMIAERYRGGRSTTYTTKYDSSSSSNSSDENLR